MGTGCVLCLSPQWGLWSGRNQYDLRLWTALSGENVLWDEPIVIPRDSCPACKRLLAAISLTLCLHCSAVGQITANLLHFSNTISSSAVSCLQRETDSFSAFSSPHQSICRVRKMRS